MLTIGDTFPDFKLTSVVTSDLSDAFVDIDNSTYAGKWLVVFAWPKDFTFICPTELAEFSRLVPEFEARDAQVLGMSTDSEFVHLAWRNDHEALSDLAYPMMSDIKRELSEALGILNKDAGVCNRATFVVDPKGVIRHVSINDLSVGRNPSEIIRILDAQKTGELCPVSWNKGDDTLKAA